MFEQSEYRISYAIDNRGRGVLIIIIFDIRDLAN